jgi:flavodoxin
MKTLLVYESAFGNTEKIAHAIGKVLEKRDHTTVIRVDNATPEDLYGVELLIVGCPTQKFQAMPATKAFIQKSPGKILKNLPVAAFDTRIAPEDIHSSFLRFLVGTFGYAAKPLANRLRRKGGILLAKPEGFYVQDTKGPLKAGELERAQAWAENVSQLADKQNPGKKAG